MTAFVSSVDSRDLEDSLSAAISTSEPLNMVGRIASRVLGLMPHAQSGCSRPSNLNGMMTVEMERASGKGQYTFQAPNHQNPPLCVKLSRCRIQQMDWLVRRLEIVVGNRSDLRVCEFWHHLFVFKIMSRVDNES